jgi:hypothetical protein
MIVEPLLKQKAESKLEKKGFDKTLQQIFELFDEDSMQFKHFIINL